VYAKQFMSMDMQHSFYNKNWNIQARGFFENLEPMEGALKAIQEMESEGLQLYLCTSPVKGSVYCAQEKLNWIVEHLGEEWLDKAILCQDKVMCIESSLRFLFDCSLPFHCCASELKRFARFL